MNEQQEYDEAYREVQAAESLAAFGDLLSTAYDNGGFDAMENRHWRAIGVAVNHFGKILVSGSLSRRLEKATDQLMDARQSLEEQS